MNPQTLGRAQGVATQIIANVQPDQMDNATPCDAWTVSQLIDHLVGAQHWGRSAVQGVEMTETGEGSAAGDFNAAFADAASACLAAFSEDGALGRTVNPGFGDMPAIAMLGLVATDTFTHAWDLAVATGQDADLDPELAAMLLMGARMSIQDSFRSEEGSIFGFEQDAPDGATNADQLAAFLGRTVG
ncbi:MAG: TIGR03086 family protein [Actinobacteria bacterium]|nr:TIGR03086 family protein [Actinomycetota bacterium]MCB9390818.1 TIGR03086 family protein [Acidimicrobiia bacterium]